MANEYKLNISLKTSPYSGVSDEGVAQNLALVRSVLRSFKDIQGIDVVNTSDTYDISVANPKILESNYFLSSWSRLFNVPGVEVTVDWSTFMREEEGKDHGRTISIFRKLIDATVPPSIKAMRTPGKIESVGKPIDPEDKSLDITAARLSDMLKKGGANIKIIGNIPESKSEEGIKRVRNFLIQQAKLLMEYKSPGADKEGTFGVEFSFYDGKDKKTEDFEKAITIGAVVMEISLRKKSPSIGVETQFLLDIVRTINNDPFLEVEVTSRLASTETEKPAQQEPPPVNKETPRTWVISHLVKLGLSERAAEDFCECLEDLLAIPKNERPKLSGPHGAIAELIRETDVGTERFLEISGLPEAVLSKKYKFTGEALETFIHRLALEPYREGLFESAGIKEEARGNREDFLGAISTSEQNTDPRRTTLVKNLDKLGVTEPHALAIYDLLVDQEQRLVSRHGNAESNPPPLSLYGPEGLLIELEKRSGLSGRQFFINAGIPNDTTRKTSANPDFTMEKRIVVRMIRKFKLNDFAETLLESAGIEVRDIDTVVSEALANNPPSLHAILKTVREEVLCLADGKPTTWVEAAKKGLDAVTLTAERVENHIECKSLTEARLHHLEEGSRASNLTISEWNSICDFYSIPSDARKKLASYSNRKLAGARAERTISGILAEVEEETGEKRFGLLMKKCREAFCITHEGPMLWSKAIESGTFGEETTTANFSQIIDTLDSTVRLWENDNNFRFPDRRSGNLTKLLDLFRQIPLGGELDIDKIFDEYIEETKARLRASGKTRDYKKEQKNPSPEGEDVVGAGNVKNLPRSHGIFE